MLTHPPTQFDKCFSWKPHTHKPSLLIQMRTFRPELDALWCVRIISQISAIKLYQICHSPSCHPQIIRRFYRLRWCALNSAFEVYRRLCTCRYMRSLCMSMKKKKKIFFFRFRSGTMCLHSINYSPIYSDNFFVSLRFDSLLTLLVINI